jgi:hypothetical protein
MFTQNKVKHFYFLKSCPRSQCKSNRRFEVKAGKRQELVFHIDAHANLLLCNNFFRAANIQPLATRRLVAYSIRSQLKKVFSSDIGVEPSSQILICESRGLPASGCDTPNLSGSGIFVSRQKASEGKTAFVQRDLSVTLMMPFFMPMPAQSIQSIVPSQKVSEDIRKYHKKQKGLP